MKVLFLIHQFYPNYSTGTEKFILNLAKMMQRCGHRVKVITYSFHPSWFYQYRLSGFAIKEYVYESVPVLAFRFRKHPEDLHFALGDSEMAQVGVELLQRENPDIVHIGHSMRVAGFIKSARQLNIPYVVTLTDFFLMCPKYILVRSNGSLCSGPESGLACTQHCPELPNDRIPKRLVEAQALLAQANAVAAPSQFLAKTFQREFPGLQPILIRHGMSFHNLKSNSRRYQHGDRIVFGYAGSLNTHKGVHILIEAFMSARLSEAELKIYGKNATSRHYVNSLKKASYSCKNISFCGEYAAGQLAEVLQGIDVIVLPSLWHENASLILCEALASNVPVIVSDAGGMNETVRNDFNGFIFRMGDVRNLSEILQTIVENPETLNRLKENIRLMTFPTIEQEAYAYEQIYKEIRIPS